MSEPQIEQRPAQPYLGIAGRITDGVPAFVDTAFPQLFRWLADHGVKPSGPPFIRFRELDRDGEPLEIEVAAPVETQAEGDERVKAGTLPAGRYLTLLHRGPYRSESAPDLAAAREQLTTWAAERGIVHSRATADGTTLPCAVERYLIGPVEEPDFTKWETEFAYLVLDE
jgi:effector-binding domain-containing protein